ncbi:glycine zipper 2TM domain-containing protein [Undibacterium sp. RuTC16W]|uniref:glycine zipper 2TM domain-containing protein n=1 Tax=Undibacterium sp. RuTC16W TaxID=3413048 RepID=UPI003BF01224
MEQSRTVSRLHPIVATAAGSVILVSLLGAAAITGLLPSSHGTVAPAAMPATASGITPLAQTAAQPQYEAPQRVPSAHTTHAVHQSRLVHSGSPVSYAASNQQPEQGNSGYANSMSSTQAPVARNSSNSPNSPLGIGIGAVIGGLLGNQVGGGNGRTLATIAGAAGGGYLGNEIAKRNP